MDRYWFLSFKETPREGERLGPSFQNALLHNIHPLIWLQQGLPDDYVTRCTVRALHFQEIDGATYRELTANAGERSAYAFIQVSVPPREPLTSQTLPLRP